MGIRSRLGLAMAMASGFTASAQAPEPCARVDAATLGLPNLVVTGAVWREAEGALPRHCLLSGRLNERTGIDGMRYAIGFEMRLPAAWNGRFLHQVNGGNDGVVLPALGDRADGWTSGGRVPLARGFAVLSSDSGHSAADPANASFGLARGASFGLDPQARRDYGYSANIALAPVAKAILAAHYGRPPAYSYMAGCSNGGRHAMVAASRMPAHYDGYLVGNPGFNLPRAAIQHAWDVQAFGAVDPDLRRSFSREDGAVVSSRIIEACDALDGARDGLVSNLAACARTLDARALACRAGGSNACLPPPKAEALAKSLAGPRNARGEPLYVDWPLDGGIGTGNWRAWKVESPVAAWRNQPIIATMGAASLGFIFSTPPVRLEGTPEALQAFLLAYDFDRDPPRIVARTPEFPESAMEFMAPPDIDDPRLSDFVAAGRRMVIYHGQADPVFSFNDTARWFAALDRNLAGKARDHVRLFAMPGVTHCGGGVGLDHFDGLTALTDWVERGIAPERVVARVNPANAEVPSDWSRDRTRPLCPWPAFARFRSGDMERDASFECARE